MRHRKFTLPGAVEQCFRLVSKSVKLLVINDSAIPFQVMKVAEQIVDKLFVFPWIPFQFQQAAVEIFRIFPRFVDKILQVSFPKGCERHGTLARQHLYPVNGAHAVAL